MLGMAFIKVNGDGIEYVQQKLLAAGVDGSDIDVDALSATLLTEAPRLADPAALMLSHEQEVESRARRRCALQLLREEAPLLPGENLVQDRFTVLALDWEELPAGTVVLERETNRATAYYLFPDWRLIDGQGVVWRELPSALNAPERPAVASLRLSAGLASLGVTDLLLPLAKALGGAIAGQVGTFLLEAVFPPSPPSYFDEVYRQLARVVGTELTQHDIDLISARLNGVLGWQRRVYNPKNPRAITDIHERERLFNQIEGEIRQLEDATAILRAERWMRPGFTVFALAGGIYLALCQEACMMDYQQKDPTKSSYFKTIQLTATEYADALERTLAEILKRRSDGLKLVAGYQNIKIGSKNYMSRTYRFEDPANGTRGPERRLRKQDSKTWVGEPHAEATRDLEAHRARLPAILESELGDPTKVIAAWRALIKQPLPI